MDLGQLRQLLGSDVLAYVTASDAATFDEDRLDTLSDDQRSVLGGVAASVERSLSLGPREQHGYLVRQVLTIWDDSVETTAANAWRVRAGGELEVVAAGGPIEQALAHLARDTYALMLAPEEQPGFAPLFGGLSPAMFHLNPWSRRLQEAILADHELGRHFTGPPESDSSSFSFWSSTGHGEGGVQLATMPDRLLTAPFERVRADSRAAADYVALAIDAASDLRRLIVAERTVRSPALIGLEGVTLPDGFVAETPWGRLRGLRNAERERLGSFAAAGNAVVEAAFPVKILKARIDVEAGIPENVRDTLDAAQSNIRECAQRVALAILLGKGDALAYGVGHAFTVIYDPFSHSLRTSGRPYPTAAGHVELTPEDAEEVSTWARLVERHHHRSVDVAVRRAVSATSRIDPSDAFIDSIIGWENLFGNRDGEATLRLAAGFALLR